MKRFILFIMPIMFLLGLADYGKSEESIFGEVQVRSSHYTDDEVKPAEVSDIRIDIGVEIDITESLKSSISARLEVDSAGISSGADLDNRSGAKKIASIREAALEITPETTLEELTIKIGKQLMNNVIGFDSYDHNPLSRRDQSEPFSTMDKGSKDGVLGVSVMLALPGNSNVFGECVVAGRNNPVIATDNNDHWTRDIPQGMSYGDSIVGSDVNYLCRLWQERDGGAVVEFAAFHGSGSGVDHVELNGLSVNPVFIEENMVYAATNFTVKDWVVRLGCSAHLQDEGDDFAACVAEADRIWRFSGGSSVFIEMGYANSFSFHESSMSDENLDMRRALNNHFIGAVEYSPVDGLAFRLAVIQSLENSDRYLRAEARMLIGDTFPQYADTIFGDVEVILRGESIEGEKSIFGAHENDDRVLLIGRKPF